MLYYNKHVFLWLQFHIFSSTGNERSEVHIRGSKRFHVCTNFTSQLRFLSQRVHNYQAAHAIFRVALQTCANTRQPFTVAIVKSINSLFYRVLRTDDTQLIDRARVETNRCYITTAIVRIVGRQAGSPLLPVFLFLYSRIKLTCNRLCRMDNRRPHDAETGCKSPCTRLRSGGNGFCAPISLWTLKIEYVFYCCTKSKK